MIHEHRNTISNTLMETVGET